MKKFTEEEIKTGAVMGPILMGLFFSGIIAFFVFSLGLKNFMYFVLSIVLSIVLIYVWFSVIPRTWNKVADFVNKRKAL